MNNIFGVIYTFPQVSSNFGQTEHKTFGRHSGDFTEHLKVIPDGFYVASNLKRYLG